MDERFGPLTPGGIRTSATSTDIIVVHSVHSGYDGVELGKRIKCDGTYVPKRSDQTVGENQRLAGSPEGGNRILYFTKEIDGLRFEGLARCVAHYDKEDPSRPGAVVFELEMADSAGRPQGARAGRRDIPPGSRGTPSPDLDTIMSVERKISDRLHFAGRRELLAALPAGIDQAGLDRILEYLEGSANISTDSDSVRWAFSGAGPQEGPSAAENGGAAAAAADPPKEPAHILSTTERLSADLDNDLPYSAETEQVIADCRAGRPIGKTYTAEEYLRHLDQEYGASDMEDAGKRAGIRQA